MVAMTKYLVTIVKVDGSLDVRELDKAPSLQQLQEYVGGYIQIVPLWTGYRGRRCTVYADEERRIHGKPLNVLATQWWQEALGPRQAAPLCGDIAIVQTQPKEK
jgi:hypothetical protein